MPRVPEWLLSSNLPDIAIVSLTARSVDYHGHFLLLSPQAKAQAGSWCLLICSWLTAVLGPAVDCVTSGFMEILGLRQGHDVVEGRQAAVLFLGGSNRRITFQGVLSPWHADHWQWQPKGMKGSLLEFCKLDDCQCNEQALTT